MDKKYEIKDYEDMTYEEVHALLVEVMQEACTSDEAGPYKSPSIDLSFMDEKPEKEKRSRIRFSRFSKVAAILIIILLGMNVVLLATENNISYSEKGLLHRICEGARGIFTDEDETKYVEPGETGDTYTITDFSKIDEAKNFWPDLCVPEYIPDGFELEELTIKKAVSGDYCANYTFTDNIIQFVINISFLSDDNKKISNNIGKVIELEDKVINVYWDEIIEQYMADIYMEAATICIYGDINKTEIEKVSKGIN